MNILCVLHVTEVPLIQESMLKINVKLATRKLRNTLEIQMSIMQCIKVCKCNLLNFSSHSHLIITKAITPSTMDILIILNLQEVRVDRHLWIKINITLVQSVRSMNYNRKWLNDNKLSLIISCLIYHKKIKTNLNY